VKARLIANDRSVKTGVIFLERILLREQPDLNWRNPAVIRRSTTSCVSSRTFSRGKKRAKSTGVY
jgi:hypothetical protein